MQVAEPTLMVSPSIPTHASFLSRKYFSTLDLFRFLAIVAVIWHHTQAGFPWFPASSRGFLGVDFFFVISGFLIVTLVLRERDRTGGISLRQFYLRRSLRIFPIYYGMIGVMTAFFLLVKPDSKVAGPFFADLPYQLLYLSNWTTLRSFLYFTWSLSTEEQFYLIWPPVEKWLRNFTIPIILGVILINQMINFGLMGDVIAAWQSKLYILQITFTPICLGVLLAHVLHDRRGFDPVAALLGRRWTSLVMVVLVVLACNNPVSNVMGWPRLLIQVAMTLLLASCVIREDNDLNRWLGLPIIRRVGVISYGMYLYHEFAAHAAQFLFDRFLVGSGKSAPIFSFFLVTLLLTIIVSELSYRFYETPFLRLKDHLSRNMARRKPNAKQELRLEVPSEDVVKISAD